MFAAARLRALARSSKVRSGDFLVNRGLGFDSAADFRVCLGLEEIEKVLSDVKADDVRVIPVEKRIGWTDYMVVATGKSAWHVRNIAQALIYKAKQKQRGADRMMLPSIEGQEGGNWIVVDAGSVIVHALEEKARSYYNLENLWAEEKLPEGNNQDLMRAFAKNRPKNNSKKRAEKPLP